MLNKFAPLIIVGVFVLLIGGIIFGVVWQDRARMRAKRAAFDACPFQKGQYVRVKLTGQKALVVNLWYYYHRKVVRVAIRSAGHYGSAENWSIRAQGFGGSSGGSKGHLEVEVWEIEPWEEGEDYGRE